MGLLGVICASRFATVMMAILSALAAFATLVIFVIDMVLWNIVRNRVRDAGGSASLVSYCLKAESKAAKSWG